MNTIKTLTAVAALMLVAGAANADVANAQIECFQAERPNTAAAPEAAAVVPASPAAFAETFGPAAAGQAFAAGAVPAAAGTGISTTALSAAAIDAIPAAAVSAIPEAGTAFSTALLAAPATAGRMACQPDRAKTAINEDDQ